MVRSHNDKARDEALQFYLLGLRGWGLYRYYAPNDDDLLPWVSPPR